MSENPRRSKRPAARRSVLAVSLVLAVLAGCRSGDGAGTGAGASDPTRPVQLGRQAGSGATAGSSILRPLDEVAVRRAVENYRINKKRAEGGYESAGADLDGDGVAEAIVLFEGQDWCAKTGCSMTVFKSDQRGFQAAFRTVRVRPPILAARSSSNGWRDLIVWTGGAGTAPKRRVLLKHSGSSYPRNAMLEPEGPLGSAIEVEVVIEAPAAPDDRSAQTSPRRNP